MAENLTVARPYAEAVFGLATEENPSTNGRRCFALCLKLSKILSIWGF